MRAALLDQRLQPIQNRASSPRLTNAFPYGQGAMALGVPITDGPEGATTATRVSYGAGVVNNPGVQFPGAVVQVGETVSVSVWIQLEYGSGEGFAPAISGVISATPTTLPVGVWTRLTAALSNRNAVVGPAYAGARQASRSSSSSAGSFLVTSVIVTSGSEVHNYADGDTPGWRWEGAPGASTSVGYPRLS